MSMRMKDNSGWTALVSLGIVATLVGLSVGVSEATEGEAVIQVDKTWTKTYSNGDGVREVYLVRSDEGDVYQITDSLYRGNFKSSDIWSQMNSGENYRIRYDGYRLGCTSSYPRIFEAERVE